MKHGRGTRGAALASDAAGRGDAPGTLLPARPAVSSLIVPRGFHVFLADSRWHGSNSSRFARNRADSGRIGWNGRNRWFRPKFKKKKKRVQNAPFDLYLNPTSAHFTQTPKHKLSTSPHISSLTRLCALCLCFVSLVAVRHSATQHLLSLLLQFILSSAFSHAFLTQVSL